MNNKSECSLKWATDEKSDKLEPLESQKELGLIPGKVVVAHLNWWMNGAYVLMQSLEETSEKLHSQMQEIHTLMDTHSKQIDNLGLMLTKMQNRQIKLSISTDKITDDHKSFRLFLENALAPEIKRYHDGLVDGIVRRHEPPANG